MKKIIILILFIIAAFLILYFWSYFDFQLERLENYRDLQLSEITVGELWMSIYMFSSFGCVLAAPFIYRMHKERVNKKRRHVSIKTGQYILDNMKKHSELFTSNGNISMMEDIIKDLKSNKYLY